MRSCRCLLLALLLGPAPARADRVLLLDGAVIEGEAREEGERVVIRVDAGTLGVPKREVRAIERTKSAIQELEARRKALQGGGAAELQALARWAQAQGLRGEAGTLFLRVLELDPNNAAAHEALGHRRLEGRWVEEDEYLRSQGLVYFGGRWLAAAEVERIEAELAERRAAREARPAPAEPPAPVKDEEPEPRAVVWWPAYPLPPAPYVRQFHGHLPQRPARPAFRAVPSPGGQLGARVPGLGEPPRARGPSARVR